MIELFFPFCVAAPGSMLVTSAVAPAATGSARTAGAAAWVFVVPGLLKFSFFTLLLFTAEGG